MLGQIQAIIYLASNLKNLDYNDPKTEESFTKISQFVKNFLNITLEDPDEQIKLRIMIFEIFSDQIKFKSENAIKLIPLVDLVKVLFLDYKEGISRILYDE